MGASVPAIEARPGAAASIIGIGIVIAGGATLFLAAFLDWDSYRIDLGFGAVSDSVDGWSGAHSGSSTIAAFLGLAIAIAAVVMLVLARAGEGAGGLRLVGWSALGVGALALLMIAVRYTWTDPLASITSISVEDHRGPGFVVALVGAGLVIVGGLVAVGFADRRGVAPPVVGGPVPGPRPPVASTVTTAPAGRVLLPPPPPPNPSQGEYLQVSRAGTNGLAIASLVLGILWIYWLGSILAIVFGYVALSQIKRSGGLQGGRGMAIAGVTLGWIWLALLAIVAVVAVATS